MPSTYYEQGRRDAEAGEVNQLYYHTYHDYKRGYDEARLGPRKAKRGGLLAFGLIMLGLGAGAGWLVRDRELLGAQPTATPYIVTATPATPSPTFPFTIATPQPTLPPSSPTTAASGLQVGAAAVVQTDGQPLRVRTTPSLNGERLASIDPGTVLLIVSGPATADGYTWWEIEGPAVRGWVVGDFLQPES